MKNLFYVFSISFLKNQLANKIFAFITLLLLLLPQYACNTTEPPSNQTLLLKLEDVSCTEAWIQFSSTNIQIPNNITLYINNQPKKTINLTTTDTLLYIDSLLPNQTYKLKVSIIPHSGGQNQESSIFSNELTVTTMDTTSHNFTWQTFTFGETGAGSSTLYDVAIIDENNIWAVGEIYMNDSLGNPDPNAYNAIRWDGSQWKLYKLQFYTFCGQSYTGSYPAKAIFAIDNNNIIISSGSQLTYLNGSVQIKTECVPVSVNKLWGSSSNDLYAVGNNGNIAHYQNSRWTKIESETNLEFLDIYGATDAKTNELQILAVCTRNLPLDKAIYKIDGNTATQISSTPIQWELFSCWFVPNRHYYVVGSGIYEKKSLTDSLWKNEPLDITHYGTSKIRGNGINDIFVVGAFGEILHFNGANWYSYINQLGTFSGSYSSLDTKGNLVVITGFESGKSKITIGKR